MKVKVWIATDKVGSKCERTIDLNDENEGITEMSEEEREEYLLELAQEEIWNMAEWGWSIVDETA